MVILLTVTGIRNLYALAGSYVVAFSGMTIVLDFGRISQLYAQRNSSNIFKGCLNAFAANQRRYAAMLTHIGVLVLVIGIIASTIYQTEKVVSMKVGDEFAIADYRMKLTDIHDVEGGNWKAEEGVFQVFEGDTLLTELRPQKRIYNATQTPTTESAIYSINMGHIFLTMPEVSPEGVAVARGVINPLVLWVWGGGIIMGLGVILNILRPRKKEE